MTYRVAVYGTLRKDCGNNVLLSNAKFIGKTLTKELYTLRSMGGCPAVDKSVPTHHVVVEVYEVTPEELKRLDRLEGYTDEHECWYNRTLTETIDHGEAYMYHIDDTTRPIISSGDWRARA